MKDNNVGKNIIQENRIEEGFYLLKFENTENKVIQANREVDKSFLQLHFCYLSFVNLISQTGKTCNVMIECFSKVYGTKIEGEAVECVDV